MILEHVVEHQLAAAGILIGIRDRIIAGRILGSRRENRALGQIQVGDRLAEIALAGRLDTERTLTQVDGVEVVLQDDVFAGDLFNPGGQNLLLDLTVKLGLEGLLCRPTGEVVVLQQLLSDGRSPLHFGTAGEKAGDKSAHEALVINAVVAVEALVLNGDKGLLNRIRDFVDRHIGAVGAGRGKAVQLMPLLV